MRRLIAVLSCLITAAAGCVALLAGVPVATAAPVAGQAGSYVPVSATRVFDSRSSRPIAPGGTVRFRASGVGSIPPTGVAAVSVNITVLTPGRAGSLSVAPGGSTSAPLLSFRAGLTDQNDETVPLAGDGSLAIHNYAAAGVQVIADVLGYYLAGTAGVPGAFSPLPLGRILDTRSGGGHGIPVGGSVRVQVTGKAGVPAANVATALVNFTVLTPARAGVLSVLPGDLAGTAVSVSFGEGVTEQSMLSTKLGADGSLVLRNLGVAAVDVVADVAGYFRAGTVADQGALTGMVPSRMLDLRGTGSELRPGQAVDVHLLGQPGWPVNRPAGLPGFGVPAMPVLFTVDRPSTAGSLAVYPSHTTWNGAASISFAAHQPFQRMLTSQLGDDGAVTIRNTGGTPIPLVADLLGYYFGRPAPLHATASQDIDPPHGQPSAVSCPSPTFCMAVESHGWVLTYDGSSWSAPVRVPGATSLYAVSCLSPTFCMAGGAGVFRFDGVSWTRTSTDYVIADEHLSCATAIFCLALSDRGYIRWDGSGWSAPQLPSGYTMYAVSCPLATFCMLATSTGAVEYDGHALGTPTGLGRSWTAVSCPSASFCELVGHGGFESHFADGHWSTPAVVATGAQFGSISCTSAGNCMALDSGGGHAVRFDGTDWTVGSIPAHYAPVSCAGSSLCIALSSYGLSALRIDGTTWSAPVVLDRNLGVLVGISCTSTSFCMAVDAFGNVLSYDGSTWSAPAPIGVSRTVDIACNSPTSCIVLGWNGEIVHFDGTTWTQLNSSGVGGSGFTALSCVGDSFCAAVTGNGLASIFDGDGVGWIDPQTVGQNVELVDVSCVSAGYCVAGSTQGVAYTWNGAGWSAGTQTPADQLGGVSCVATDYCLQGGAKDAAIWNGASWRQLSLPDASALNVLTCLSPTNCVAGSGLAGGSEIADFNGSSWSMPVSLSGGSVGLNDFGRSNTISCPTADFCMVLDNENAYRLDG